jgi:hypothetical protein
MIYLALVLLVALIFFLSRLVKVLKEFKDDEELVVGHQMTGASIPRMLIVRTDPRRLV